MAVYSPGTIKPAPDRKPARVAMSAGLTAAASTAMRTWPRPGSGIGSAANSSTSVPPKLRTITACIVFSVMPGTLGRCDRRRPHGRGQAPDVQRRR